jgi:hypothetical protein
MDRGRRASDVLVHCFLCIVKCVTAYVINVLLLFALARAAVISRGLLPNVHSWDWKLDWIKNGLSNYSYVGERVYSDLAYVSRSGSCVREACSLS